MAIDEFTDGDLTRVVRYGGVALFDEVNMAHPRITSAWHQLLAVTRRMSVPENGETIKAGEGGIGAPQPTLFGAAYNPHYQGTVRLNEALYNRFAIQLDWDYDRAVEQQLVDSTRLLDLAENIRSLSEIRTPVSTNSLMEFERHVDRFGMPLSMRLFVNRFAPEERGPVMRALEANAEANAEAIATDLKVAYEVARQPEEVSSDV
jgi:MoxR-like ATPase